MSDFEFNEAGILVPCEKVAYRHDAWVNSASGMGVAGIDKTAQTTYSSYGSALSQQTLRALYRYDWLSRKVCLKPAKDATRKGIQYKNESVNKKAQQKFKDTDLKRKVRSALAWARLTGGAGCVLITKDDPLSPLEPSRDDRLVDIEVYDKYELNPVAYDYDYNSPNYMMPVIYETYTGKQFHYTRVGKFYGAELTREDERTELYWSGSIVEAVWSAIKHLQATYEDVRYILSELNIGILGIPNLTETNSQQGPGGAAKKVQKRVDSFNLTKSNQRVAAIDAEESFQFVNRTVTGVNELMDQFRNEVSAASDMGELILFNKSPSGLNATQEEQLAVYYDDVSDLRENQVAPFIEQVNKACGWHGEEWQFESLWEMSDKDKSQVMQQSAQAVAPLINTLMTPEEALAQLNSLSVWNIEDASDKAPDMTSDD